MFAYIEVAAECVIFRNPNRPDQYPGFLWSDRTAACPGRQVMCVQYWPSLVDKEETYGGIHVTVLREEQLANFVIRSIRLRHGAEVRPAPSVGSLLASFR